MTVTLARVRPARAAPRSRSTSIANSAADRAASGSVIAPRPGPISINRSVGSGAMAATSLATHAASRKCWPNRLRAFTTPVALLDLHDLVLGHPEIVAELVNQRVADFHDDAVFVALTEVLDGLLIQRDPIGQGVAEGPAPLGQRRSLIQPEQLIIRFHLQLVEHIVGRPVLDDNGDVGHGPGKTRRDGVDRLGDEHAKALAGHRCA